MFIMLEKVRHCILRCPWMIISSWSKTLSDADVIILSGDVPNGEAIKAKVEQGSGLVLILGPDLTASQINGLLGEYSSPSFRDTPLSLNGSNTNTDPILEDIVWTSAPQIRERYQIDGSSFTPLVVGFEDGSLVLGTKKVGLGADLSANSFSQFSQPTVSGVGIFQLPGL